MQSFCKVLKDRSLFFSVLLQYTSQAAAAAFQGPARTAHSHLFVANTILVYLPSVIHALPFPVFGDRIKTCSPQFNDGTLKLQQGRILNLHLLPFSPFSPLNTMVFCLSPIPLEQMRSYIPPLKSTAGFVSNLSLSFLGRLPPSPFCSCLLFVFCSLFGVSKRSIHSQLVRGRSENQLSKFSRDCGN